MRHLCFCLAVVVCGVQARSAVAQPREPPGLMVVSGLVEKVDKNSLTIRPRGADGKFGKSVVLKLTGTSKITTLGDQRRGGKVTLVQRDTDAKDLRKNQGIAVIYGTGPTGPVLLAAVVHPSPK